MLNALTNAKNLVLLLFAIANAYPSLPTPIYIAEYCVAYEKKESCECERGSTNVFLRLEKVLRELSDIPFCTFESHDFYWMTKSFLIHDDLEAEWSKVKLHIGYTGTLHDKDGIHTTTLAEWNFAREVPIYAKDTDWVDLGKYNKYYAEGKIIPVEWQLKASCGLYYKATFSGSYFIRIIGECDK